MNQIIPILTLLLLLATKQHAYSQTRTDTRQQYTSIGDFPLENGQHITDCRIGYRTFGKLNATRSNAIIYPSAGGGTTFYMQFSVNKDVDTTRFYLILIDALGNGVSSSPSNSTAQPKTSFPQFSIRDMVNTQYKMLTEKLDIHHLAAVVGGSMGGCQALQWAVSYPDFMDKIVAIDATPRLTAYDLLWTSTYIDAVKSDTAYHSGNYTVNPPVPMAARLSQLLISTPASVNSTTPADSFSSWYATIGKTAYLDANNFLWQMKATMMQDITKGEGSLESAAKKVKAKVLIIANKQDRIFIQTPSIKFAKLVNAELVEMDDDSGHLIFGGKIPVDTTRKFLTR
ncbi:MAG: Homoserine O-acetyltransferase [Bacteroidetes bacterium]|nr:Homoserine O-acetyltransferase [Bacteroidota bacterium]